VSVALHVTVAWRHMASGSGTNNKRVPQRAASADSTRTERDARWQAIILLIRWENNRTD
jgi:hypothetical protein